MKLAFLIISILFGLSSIFTFVDNELTHQELIQLGMSGEWKEHIEQFYINGLVMSALFLIFGVFSFIVYCFTISKTWNDES